MNGQKNSKSELKKQIKDEARTLINSGLSTGLSIALGNTNSFLLYNDGFCESGFIRPVNEDTIVDIASLTKLFLSICFFSISEKMPIDFTKSLKYYSNKFPFIENISLNDLFHFNCNLRTTKRITDCTYQQALNEIYNIKNDSFNKPNYSDMPSIVLGLLFKEIFGCEFGDYFNDNFVNNLNLCGTFFGKKIPNSGKNYFNYDNEMIIVNNQLQSFKQKPLVVNDRKAEILSNDGEFLVGNAGIFTCSKDMAEMCTAILSEKMISKRSLLKISTGSNSKFAQRFGYLVYSKSPNNKISEIPSFMSDKAFGMSGFTGTYLLIDPVKDCFVFLAGNRLNNKITAVDDQSLICGNKIIYKNNLFDYSKNYVYERDKLRDYCCKYLIK